MSSSRRSSTGGAINRLSSDDSDEDDRAGGETPKKKVNVPNSFIIAVRQEMGHSNFCMQGTSSGPIWDAITDRTVSYTHLTLPTKA